jgi:hypothetical protein
MAGFTGRARAKMLFVAEKDITRDLVDSHPRNGLLSRGETGQFLNRRAVFLHRLVASHTFRGRRNSHHFTRIRHLMAIGALQAQGDVLLVTVRNRLDRRFGREKHNRNCEQYYPAQTLFFRISSAIYSADRIDSARIVSVGFCEPPETNELPSTTNRFFTSWLWLY